MRIPFITRTRRKKAATGGDAPVNIILPTNWHSLSERQLRYVFWLYSTGMDFDTILAYCVIRWSGLKDIRRYDDCSFVVKYRKRYFRLIDIQMYDLCMYLKFLCEIPDKPVNLPTIKRHRALPVDFRGVPFETYLMVNNLYTGYLMTQKAEILLQCGQILYQSESIRFKAEELQSIFFWLGSLMKMFSIKFCHLYGDSVASPEQQPAEIGKKLQDVMNSQIRALTKGDITKEEQILKMDTWRALTELDALAREYEELNQKYPQK